MSELLGKTISRYRVVGPLGAGGMGVVYRAHDERLGRDLALKILPPETMADESARVRFTREARLASSLNHPHIAHIYEVGEDGGHLFIAMELIEGRPLRELIPPEGLPVESVVAHAIPIADALAHAHERGVIHRDLKSANVMVSSGGWVKVLDFGLAKRIEEETGGLSRTDMNLTSTGMVLGTPNYLPPEILLGARADARSDVWALGVVLYEMTTGKLPFVGASVSDLAHAIVHATPTPMSGRVAVGLRAVIERCLAKRPEDRFANGAQVRAALENLRSGRPRSSSSLARRLWIPAGVLLLALAGALATSFGGLGKRNAARSAPAPPAIGSLAVLPLANLSGDPNQEYFADGMTEELITDLASIRTLKVISRTSVMPFKGSQKSLREIARELDVDAVVEGSVMRAGDRVRISAQLIEGDTDQHLWARSYERDFVDVLALQSEVARDIAQEIKLQLTPRESGRFAERRQVNPEAYDLYLKGRFQWSKMTEEGVRQAIGSFEKAQALDPGDARYASALADAHLVLIQVMGSLSTKEGMPKVKEYAQQALAADDESAEAHASMGAALFFGDWSFAEAERHMKRAIELNPNYSTGHLIYSVLLVVTGRFDEAMEHDRLAIELDPLALLPHWSATMTFFSARRFDDALVQAQRTLELDPTSDLARSSFIRIYEQMGEFEKAITYIEKYLPEKLGGAAFAKELREAYATSGSKGYYRKLLESATERKPPPQPIHLAMLHAQLGDTERAFEYLEKSFDDRSADLLFLNVEGGFDPIRSDPRFQAIVRRIGLIYQS